MFSLCGGLQCRTGVGSGRRHRRPATLAGPKVSRVIRAATSPISAYGLNSSAGPTQPNYRYSRVVMNGVKPDTIAEIW